MIIIETCPKCGGDLLNEVIDIYPPIPCKRCLNCGWSWEGEQEKIVRVPFGGNTNTFTEKDNTSISWNGSSTDWYNIDIKTSTDWDSTNIKTSSTINTAFGKEACENCPSNPKNGGDGICFCTLGQNIIY